MSNISFKSFEELSEKVARNFIHTVVVVDDEANFLEEKKITATTVAAPSREKPKVKEEKNSKNEANSHGLDAKEIIDIFASKGIICSALRPSENDESAINNTVNAANRADVMIIDWEIWKDNGKTAIEIISKTLEEEKTKVSRVRLIIIYTGEKDIKRISEHLKKSIENHFTIVLNTEDDGLTLKFDYLKIAVFAKENVNVVEQYKNRSLSIEQLSNQISKEFAKITSGLVSNVALESKSVLRDNMHLILGNLGPNIDPPYLAHRSLLPNPEDAKRHAVELVASEIQSALENFDVREIVNLKELNKWLRKNKEIINKKEICGIRITTKDLYDWLKDGILETKWFKEYLKKHDKKERKNVKKNFHNQLTDYFCIEDSTSQLLNSEFAMLTSIKNRYEPSKYRPILSLGTIVLSSRGQEDQYWLCVQPKCDSVRIKQSRKFMFLKMGIVTDNDKFDVVIKNNIKLKVNYKIHESSFFTFETRNTVIKGKKKKLKNEYYFESINFLNNKEHLEWIGELKPNHAQRIAHKYASQLSRIGLDESEWLRRSSEN